MSPQRCAVCRAVAWRSDPQKRVHDIGDVWLLLDEAPAASPRSTPWLGIAGWAVAAAALAGLGFMLHFREQPPAAPTVRFEVRMPEKSGAAFFKLSPNGQLLAVVDTATRRLEVRPLDSPDFRELPGTDNARHPFGPRINSSIGFFADGRLKKVAANGGPVQTLCEAANGRGTWNSDGVIVFFAGPKSSPATGWHVGCGPPRRSPNLGQDSDATTAFRIPPRSAPFSLYG